MSEDAELSSVKPTTFFGRPSIQFPDSIRSNCDADGPDYSTDQFLIACAGVAEFLDAFGRLFLPVKYDIMGNVDKVREKYTENPDKYATLKQLIDSCLAADSSHSDKVAVEDKLLWLKRGMEFFFLFLKLLAKSLCDGVSHQTCVQPQIRSAYERALSRHHGFMSRQLFKVVIHAAPTIESLLSAATHDQPNLIDQAVLDTQAFLIPFEECLFSLCNYYNKLALETTPPTDFDVTRMLMD